MDSFTCKWKRCRQQLDIGVRSSHNGADYWLCQEHWKQLCNVSNELCADVHKMCKPLPKEDKPPPKRKPTRRR